MLPGSSVASSTDHLKPVLATEVALLYHVMELASGSSKE